MLVRNQVRRHLLFTHSARSHQSPSRSITAGFEGEGDGVPQRILTANERGARGSLLASGRTRFFFSSNGSPSANCPKSTTPDVSSGENSHQTIRESRFKRYLPKLLSSANFHGEAKRGAQDVLGSSSRQKVHYAEGAGAAAVVMFVGAMVAMSYEEETPPTRRYEVLLSTWSILWESLAEFKVKMGKLFRDGVGDIVEATAAATILARCLMSVLLTVGEEPTVGLSSWLMPGVAALVADLAAHENRRKAVVEAGGGRVVDWLLNAVGVVDPGGCLVTQAEAARALAHLLSDESTCEAVLSRPHALPYLFQFASSLHVTQGLQDWSKVQDAHLDGISTGRSMLVTAVLDLITSSCDVEDESGVRPKLPGNADPVDIAAALRVIKDGGWLSDDHERSDGDSAGKAANDTGGVHGIGIRVLGGTGIVGTQGVLSSCLSSKFNVGVSPLCPTQAPTQVWRQENYINNQRNHANLVFNGISPKQGWGIVPTAFADYSPKKYGLWDDLQGQHITVPLAAWALAMWARASNSNRAKIAELDDNGDALLIAVLASEKTVKWHGAMAMRSLLASKSHFLSIDVASRWSSALLNVAAQAGRLKDPSLTHCALAALTSCVSRSKSAQTLVLQEGLPIMRGIAGETEGNTLVQGALAQVLDALTNEGELLPGDESKKWAAILLKWVCHLTSDNVTRSCGSRVLERVVNNLGVRGIPVTQAWLAMLLMEVISDGSLVSAKGKRTANLIAEAKEREQLQNQVIQAAIVAAAQLAKVVAQEAIFKADTSDTEVEVAESASELPMIDLLGLDVMGHISKSASKEALPKVTATEAAVAVQRAIKALTELTAEDPVWRQRILEAGVLCLLRRFLLCDDYEQWAASEASETISQVGQDNAVVQKKGQNEMDIVLSVCPHIRKHAIRLLAVLSLQSAASEVIAEDKTWVTWLEDCAGGKIAGSSDIKTRSYALTSLLNVSSAQIGKQSPRVQDGHDNVKSRLRTGKDSANSFWPRYEDSIFILNTGSKMWTTKLRAKAEKTSEELWNESRLLNVGSLQTSQVIHGLSALKDGAEQSEKEVLKNEPVMDVIFVHGLRGGPLKTWRVADSKASTTTPLVERIDMEAGKKGTCWPDEWLGSDLPRSRLLSVKYKTNLSEWSGATLPLQEVSSMLLDKLLAAGVGERPLVFVTHSMGGLVVKQMLLQAGRDETRAHLLNHTTGIVFYSCPHFGSKLADMPWRIGYVLRPAPTIGELRSGSPRLEELNRCLRQLHKEGHLDVLSFSETKVTPLVEGYGGWGLRLEVVPIESAYPGFGELVVLPGTDHVNSCKPLDRADPAYTKTLEFLQNLELYAVGVSEQD